MATGKHRAPNLQRQKVGSVVAAGAVPLVMALIGAVILAVSYAIQLVFLAVIAVAVLTLIDNVREIRAS